MQITATLVLVSSAVAGLLGGWGGYRVGVASCADARIEHVEQLRDQALAYAGAWTDAVDDAEARLETHARRLAEARRQRAAALSHAEELRHALDSLPARHDCHFDDAELRALADLRRAYFPRAGAGRVPAGMPGAAGAGLRPADGDRGSVPVGLRVREPAQ